MFDNMTSDSKVKSIKSSDSKIATAKWSADNPYAIKITVKKKGKTVISGTLLSTYLKDSMIEKSK